MTDDQRRLLDGATDASLAEAVNEADHAARTFALQADAPNQLPATRWYLGKRESALLLAAACVADVLARRKEGGG